MTEFDNRRELDERSRKGQVALLHINWIGSLNLHSVSALRRYC